MKLRFSLRALLILIALLGVLLATVGREVQRCRTRLAREQAATEKLIKAGARVSRQWDGPDWAIGWLAEWDGFLSVYHVDFGHLMICDDDLAAVVDLHDLSWLDVGVIVTPESDGSGGYYRPQMQVTEGSLDYLRDLPLDSLCLDCTQVTDAAIDKLSEFTRLRVLSIEATNISKEGAEELRRRLPECKVHWSTGRFR